jgi:S-formylglutathione hydrolase FrmB
MHTLRWLIISWAAALCAAGGLDVTTAVARADLAAVCSMPPDTPAFGGSPRVIAGDVDGVRFNVLLPPGYATSTRSYPVLYLLAGADDNQDSWLAATDLIKFTAALPASEQAIVVMPTGDPLGINVDFRNGTKHWETLYLRHLIPYVDKHYRTIGDRSHRAIAGNSAGGLTATHDAARHPDLFTAVGSFSGIDDITLASPAGELALFPLERLDEVCDGGQPTDTGIVGNPVTDDVYWHNANPTDLAENLRGLSLYVAAGSGVPCTARDLQDLSITPLTAIEPEANAMSQSFAAALTHAGVKPRTDFYGCGIHWFNYFQRDLHTFWPQMIHAFGTPPETSFDYRRADPAFTVWGWSFEADPRRAVEFLDIHDASGKGLTLTGSGTEQVTTSALFRPGTLVHITGATTAAAIATRQGQITFHVGLGPPHRVQQYTPSALAERFQTRTVRFAPTGSSRRRLGRSSHHDQL